MDGFQTHISKCKKSKKCRFFIRASATKKFYCKYRIFRRGLLLPRDILSRGQKKNKGGPGGGAYSATPPLPPMGERVK